MKTPRMKKFETIPVKVDHLAREVVDAALKVHRHLGPGLLESVYETCLVHELKLRGLRLEKQVEVLIINFNVPTH